MRRTTTRTGRRRLKKPTSAPTAPPAPAEPIRAAPGRRLEGVLIDDSEVRTTNAATLWLDDEYSRSVYTAEIETVDLPDSPGCQSVTLSLRWLDTSEAGTVEDNATIPIAGGSRGVRAFLALLERLTSRAEAKGHLVFVPPAPTLNRAG